MDLDSLIVLLAALVIGLVGYFWYYVPRGGKDPETPLPAKPASEQRENGSSENAKEKEEGSKLPAMKILFGSQSGTAETYAQELGEEARRHGFRAEVLDLDEFEPESLQSESLAVFLVATYGEGDPSDSAAAFQDWLLASEQELPGLSFAVFGLGNRQYEQFCAVGRRFDKKLGKLGAVRMLPLGEGDDDGSLEDDYTAWKARFWARMQELYLAGAESLSAEVPAFVPAWEVSWNEELKFDAELKKSSEEEDDEDVEEENDGVELAAGAAPLLHKCAAEVARIVGNRELRKSTAEGSTRLISIDISGCSFRYQTADNLEILPKNNPRLVRALAQRLGLQLDAEFSFRPSSAAENNAAAQEQEKLLKKMGLPAKLSVRNALDWFLDFTAVPRSKGLQVLAQYAEDAEEREKLDWLANAAEGKAEMQAKQKGLLRLLMEFRSVRLPWAALLEICPRVLPRTYTISSSALVKPDVVELTVVLSSAQLPWGLYEGLCTGYLARLHHGHRVCVSVRASSFRVPADPARPLIMVGPGTGVAPFRAFIQEFSHLQKRASPSRGTESKEQPEEARIPPLVLYFGCRHRERDFIFEEEIRAAHEDEVLEAAHVAFSRDTAKQIYVSDLIPKHAPQLWDYLEARSAHIYVCGSASMGRGVHKAFLRVLEDAGKLPPQEAEAYVARLQAEHRYVQELWS